MDFRSVLEKLEEEGNLRKLPAHLGEGVIDLSSNDYLGLAKNEDLARQFLDSHQEVSFSTSSSRLLSSRQNEFMKLESFLENEYNRPTLLYNSGYHANVGTVAALASDSKTLIVADKLVHASIIDGVVLSRADFRRFPHNDMSVLKKLIEKNIGSYERIIVITESVFSMDGDRAPLDEILSIKERFPEIILYLDEAHSFGVAGRKGLGMAQDTCNPEAWDIIVCTLGKAAASQGAFVVCDKLIKDFLINKSRTFIFSTALPPLQVKWSRFMISRILTMDAERKRLSELGLKLSEILREVDSRHHLTDSHIQPLILGDSKGVVRLSDRLFSNGIKAMPIRKPTVPAGTERIRFSLSADLTYNELETLKRSLNGI